MNGRLSLTTNLKNAREDRDDKRRRNKRKYFKNI
jgi:hypothetical protein